MKLIIVLCYCAFLSTMAFSQSVGSIDDFDGAQDDLWIAETTADYPQVYVLSSENGVLRIEYKRLPISGPWNQFRLELDGVEVSGDSRLELKVRSDVAAVFSIKPKTMSGASDWLEQDLVPDNEWYTCVFSLENTTPEDINNIYFYIDGGSEGLEKSGTVFMEYLSLGDKVLIKGNSY